MADNEDNISVEMAALSVNGEEIVGIEFQEEEVGADEEGYSLCLVGRFLTDSQIKFQFMKQTMASVWKPAAGMSVTEVVEGLYVFKFYHAVDRDRVMNMGPWTFRNHLLLIEKMDGYSDPREVPLFSFSIWVQIHGLKPGFNSENVVERVGNEMGMCLECDENNFSKVKTFSSSWNSYMRMRVRLDVRKPLWKNHYLRKKGGTWFKVEFIYEKLPTFCYICGFLGHGEKFCPSLLETKGKPVRKYGLEIRSEYRPQQYSIGARWLRDDDGMFGAAAGGGQWRRGGTSGVNDFGIPYIHGGNSGNNSGNVYATNDGENKGSEDMEGDNNGGDSVLNTSSEKEGITINETKRRRMGPEKQPNLGSHTSSTIKNGPAVGLLERTRRSQ